MTHDAETGTSCSIPSPLAVNATTSLEIWGDDCINSLTSKVCFERYHRLTLYLQLNSKQVSV